MTQEVSARPRPTTTPLAETAQKSFMAVPPWHCRHTATGDLQPGATIYASMAYPENQSRRQPRPHDAANKPHTLDNLNINDEGRRRRPPTAAAEATGGRPPTSAVGAAAGGASMIARVPTTTALAARQSTAPDPTTATVPSCVPTTHAARGVTAHQTTSPTPPEHTPRHHRYTATRRAPKEADPAAHDADPAKSRADTTSRAAGAAAMVATMLGLKGRKGVRWRTVREPCRHLPCGRAGIPRPLRWRRGGGRRRRGLGVRPSHPRRAMRAQKKERQKDDLHIVYNPTTNKTYLDVAILLTNDDQV
jgi:hypothetical protein